VECWERRWVKAKVAKRAGESREQPSSALGGKTATFNPQGTALSENDGTDAKALG